MKRIFTFSLVTVLFTVFLSACVKEGADVDESYWLSKERGYVVYSGVNCNYFVVETSNGYTIIESWSSSKPFEGAVIYGDFSRYGVIDYYNRSSGRVLTGDVKDYWLSYYDAQYAMEYYCY